MNNGAMSHNITAHQAEEWLKSGEAVLIDVREPDEFKQEHIVYAQSVPLAQVENRIKAMQLPEHRKLIMQCKAGKRGEAACLALIEDESFSRPVYNIEGGIGAWRDAGFPVISAGDSGPKISIFRQVQMIVGGLIVLFIALGFLAGPWGFVLAGVLAAALAFAGITGWCGLAMALRKMPWNK